MTNKREYMSSNQQKTKMSEIIKVIGVGGGGSNAVNYMYNQGIKGVDFVVCNTDRQALDISPVPCKIQLGKTLTEGRGAGMLPEVGMNAAFENIEELREMLSENTKMVFVTAGMGGGTGTGAAPVIAQISKELGILTVGIVTVPFDFEGKKRKMQAEEGLERLRQNVDTLLVISNDKLRTIGKSLSVSEAFQKADNILTVAAKGIAEVIAETGLINVDFNDVNTVLRNSGRALMGSAMACGENRALEAVKGAMNSPLLNDHDIYGASYVLLNITYGNEEILMDEIMEITDFIQDAAGDSAEVIWGYGYDSNLDNNLCVTLVATGFSSNTNESTVAIPERKVMNLTDEVKNEITAPLSSPFDATSSVPKDVPFLKVDSSEISSPSANNIDSWNSTIGSNTASEVSSIEGTATPENAVVNPTPLDTSNTSFGNTENSAPNPVKFGLFDELESTNTPVDNNGSDIVWDVQPTSTPTFDFTENNSTDNMPEEEMISPVNETPKIQEPEIIRYNLQDDLNESINVRTQPLLSPEEVQRRNDERVAKIQEITSKIQNSENLSEYETQPAYLRRNVEIRDEKPSEEQRISRFGLSDGANGESGLGNNSFLHDNVD
jgi:cell division protein FtsZ